MSHYCPRPECSRTVEDDDMYACKPDWFALPNRIRSAIWSAWNRGDEDGHAQAKAEALAWYRANPPRYARRGGVART